MHVYNTCLKSWTKLLNFYLGKVFMESDKSFNHTSAHWLSWQQPCVLYNRAGVLTPVLGWKTEVQNSSDGENGKVRTRRPSCPVCFPREWVTKCKVKFKKKKNLGRWLGKVNHETPIAFWVNASWVFGCYLIDSSTIFENHSLPIQNK